MRKKITGFFAVILSVLLLTSCNNTNVPSQNDSDIISENVSLNDSLTVSSEDSSIFQNTVGSIYSEEAMITYQRKEPQKGYMYNTAKILCFGDSFTSGGGTNGGYRFYLFDKLYRAGASFEFVGQYQQNFYNLPDRYTYHLGVGGKKTDDAISMYTGYVEKFGNDYDIILCMFGINDCYAGRTNTEIFSNYSRLLDTIYEDKEDAIVYVASLPMVETVFEAFNSEVASFCQKYSQDTERELYFVDMNGTHALSKTTDCLAADDIHPNNLGNEKIAASWYDAIVNRVLEINDDFTKGSDKTVRAESVALDKTSAEVAIGESLSLRFEVLPAETDVKTVLWKSSNTNIATVDIYGIVTPVATGTATIAVETLDGKHTSECVVTVTDTKTHITDRYTKEIFDSKFSTTENWTGDIDIIKTDKQYASTAWIGDAKAITTAKEINFGDDFKIDMRYSVSGGEEAVNDNKYSSLSFGEFKLVISRCAGKIELFQNNESLGSYNYHSITNRFDDYSLVYNKGNIIVLRNNETLFEAQSKSVSIKSTLTYTWNVSWNKATCMHIKVSTAE